MTKIWQLQPDYEQPCINTQTKTMFKVWDKVRIKSREQMEKEFGLDSYWNWNISCLNTFTKTMKPLCWMTWIIYRATPYDIELIDRSYNIDISDWALSIDMIELIEENKTEPERTPTPWEYVEVSDGSWLWDKKIYLATLNWKYNCVIDSSKKKFYEWKYYKVAQWNYIRPLQTKQTYTIEATNEQREKIQEILS